jgi:hypothetical protein
MREEDVMKADVRRLVANALGTSLTVSGLFPSPHGEAAR